LIIKKGFDDLINYPMEALGKHWIA